MIVLVTGERNAGKTTVVQNVVTRVRNRGLEPVGFYTGGGPETLELVSVRTGERTVFATQSGSLEGGLTVGRYTVDPAAVEWGLTVAARDGDVLVVDEIGTLERNGAGFYPILEGLDPTAYTGVLCAVRDGVVPFVVDAFPSDSTVETLEVTESNRSELPTEIVELLLEAAN